MGLTKADSEFLKCIGRNIRAIRERKKLSQVELANLCDFEKPSMNRIEAGGTNITAKTLLKIANALEVKVSELVKVK